MKIGIVGSRRRNKFDDYKLVYFKVKEITNGFLNGYSIVSGGCSKGGDRFAEELARHQNYEIEVFPANWNRYGDRAGFVRNSEIAKESDILIACVSPDRTGGTEDTIRKFVKLKGDKNLHIV